MSPNGEFNYLVVCSGEERALELAQVLSGSGQVYRCLGRIEKEWKFHCFKENDWKAVSGNAPKTFDALFFHVGLSDPTKVPLNCKFVKKFAFSSPGLSVDAAQKLGDDVIPIQRPFRPDSSSCPIKRRHLNELEAFIKGRSELPSFCRPEETFPTLSALAVLCQGYLAAHFPRPAETSGPVRQALEMMGWIEFSKSDIGKQFVNTVAGNANITENSRWWQETFDFNRDELLNEISEEWGEKPPREMFQLASAIYEAAELRGGEGEEIVALAYMKLAERFNRGSS